MAQSKYTVSDLYQGGYSSLDPKYGNIFSGYNVSAGSLGLTTDARTANMLQDVSSKLSTGIKQIEVEGISPETFETVPKDQLKEINRLSKLTGVDISLHGPLIEASGITKEGFTSSGRETAERQMLLAVERGHELNPNGNIPITFHSSAILPGIEYKKTPEGKKVERLIVIDQETGKMAPMEEETRYRPEKYGEEKIYSPQQQLESLNNTNWMNSLTNIENHQKEAEILIKRGVEGLGPKFTEYKKGEEIKLTEEDREAYNYLNRADIYLQNIQSTFSSMYDKAYKYADEKEKEKLKEIGQIWKEHAEKIEKEKNPLAGPTQKMYLFNDVLAKLREIEAPKVYVPIEEFAVEESAKTFANVAFNSYKKFGDKAPIITIENPPVGGAFSTGEELKKLVEKSKEKFVENAVEKGMDKKEAKKQADKLLGVTWDVGHINMIKKYGFENKDILKETEQIAPLVKHIHLSDNFGFEHTELPMGMGNVPIKDIMGKLGKKGFEAKKIIEAIGWWQNFKTPPFQATLEAMGSPVYSMQMGPYWSQSTGFQQNYSSGYGLMLPEKHFETFGGGFSGLPTELGGRKQGGAGSRVSGTPME